MARRPRPLKTPNGPERTDLPYEFEICEYLGIHVDPSVPCPEFYFTIFTEHPENLREFPLKTYRLASKHVIDAPSIKYRLHPFGRTWFEYLIGLPYRQRVDITVRLIGSNTNEPLPQQ